MAAKRLLARSDFGLLLIIVSLLRLMCLCSIQSVSSFQGKHGKGELQHLLAGGGIKRLPSVSYRMF